MLSFTTSTLPIANGQEHLGNTAKPRYCGYWYKAVKTDFARAKLDRNTSAIQQNLAIAVIGIKQ
jgi:hypothetical protein